MRLFDSFFLTGFESACHINKAGLRLNMLALTQHDRQAATDYELLRSINIRTVRDGTCWPLIERGGAFDFASLAPMVDAANRHGMQVIWNVFHYGCPDDVDLFSTGFVDRFVGYCTALAHFIQDHSDRSPFYTPINEISFLSWAAGQVGHIHHFGVERGLELKRQLVRAAIAGIEAIWQVAVLSFRRSLRGGRFWTAIALVSVPLALSVRAGLRAEASCDASSSLFHS